MHIRDAVKEDAYELARLHALAADGFIEYSYGDLVAGVDPIELFGRVIEAGHEPYSYRNCVVAEDAGRVVGKVHTYGCDDIASVMPDDPYIPAERLAIINSAFPPTPVSWHIEAMAVLPEYQGQGLGKQFIEIAKDPRVGIGSRSLSQKSSSIMTPMTKRTSSTSSTGPTASSNSSG